VEAILGICHASGSNASTKPNLVVISYDANSIQEKLTALGIKVVNQGAPTNLQGAYSQILTLGRLTGHTKKAKHLVSTMKKEIAASVASVPAHAGKSLTTYYELDTTYYSLTSSTFVGGLMTLVGMSNIADAKNTSADAGYPQLSAEYIASANPKLILLADTICCHATQQSVAARPGFAHIAAVTHDDVIGLNDDIASRWGPRLPLLVAALAKAARNAFASTTLWK
jgi:iron complex transport system substrate-binding protein